MRILSRNRDLYFDLAGGNRIPKISERRARSVAELRAAGVGVDRVLFVHDGSVTGHDLFQAILTTLDPQVALTLAHFAPGQDAAAADHDAMISEDQQRAQQLKRDLQLLTLEGEPGPSIVNAAAQGSYDLIVLALSRETSSIAEGILPAWADYVISNASGYVFSAVPPPIPALTEGQ